MKLTKLLEVRRSLCFYRCFSVKMFGNGEDSFKVIRQPFLPCPVKVTDHLSSCYDGLVIVTDTPKQLTGSLENLVPFLESYSKIDKSFLEKGGLLSADVPGGRIVYAPTGPIVRDYDDVRRFSDAASKGLKRAIEVGIKRPLFLCPPNPSYKNNQLVSLLGALHSLYVPLEGKESKPHETPLIEYIGLWRDNEDIATEASFLECGKSVCRDIGGSDPERMCPVRIEEYIHSIFDSSNIKVEVVSNAETLAQQYPLFQMVNRGSLDQARHHGRIIYLTYEGEGPITSTLYIVGKGVTYDTGGHDLKVGGSMVGMHRDKCGAASVAGLMHSLSLWKPPGIKVVGGLAILRNSVGVNAYVADELGTARSGIKIRIGNTDAEGRMAMADLLCKFKEDALSAVNPHLVTIATLTGHARMTVGEGYSIIVENGPAKKEGLGYLIQSIGEQFGDMFEMSTLRREDYETHAGKYGYEDIVQYNNHTSHKKERGHQKGAAFLIMASGLDKHGLDSPKPLSYSHIDIAASSGPYPGIPSGSTITALFQYIKTIIRN